MKKRILSLALLTLLASTNVTAFADAKDDRIAELESQVAELQSTIDELQAQLEKSSPASTSQDQYNIGESWIVDGQWKLTINSVEETSNRNSYSDYTPAAVYIVTYTYENLGYEDSSGIMDGLYISFYDGIVDSAGKMGYEYPGDITKYPTETPVGANCEAQVCIGVDNAGDFKIHYTNYDGSDTKQSAVFAIAVE